MEAEQHHDDQSHYEISLTAGQAFIAFVLLLLSLAASFAFGLMIGKGQADERLVVQKATPVVTEASLAPKKGSGEIVELPVDDHTDFPDEEQTETAAATETSAPAAETSTDVVAAVITESAATPAAEPAPAPAAQPAADAPKVAHYAQLLSTSDQKVAEGFAAKLIERGYTSAYVERGAATEKGPVYRVRVKFPSEQEARAAEPKLREFSKEVWITAK
jgi:cell division septation protein DedD